MTDTLTAVFTQPSCEALCALQADLLQAGHAPDTPALQTLEQFFIFVNELSAGMSARHFSQLATLFDIGAVGGVAVQNLLDASADSDAIWKRVLVGGLSEALMVVASRQYVKGAETEITAVYRNAGWYLYHALWQVSAQLQPEQPAAQRRQLLDQLLAPVHDDAVDGGAKAVLLGRLFQLLLLTQLRQSAVLAANTSDSTANAPV